MTTKEKFGLLFGIPSWLPERYKGVHILGAFAVLLCMILSHVLFPWAGLAGEIAGLLVGYYLTLASVLTLGGRYPWVARVASSNSLVVTTNVVFGLVAAALSVAGVFAYIDTRSPVAILGTAFFGVGAVVLFGRAWGQSARLGQKPYGRPYSRRASATATTFKCQSVPSDRSIGSVLLWGG